MHLTLKLLILVSFLSLSMGCSGEKESMPNSEADDLSKSDPRALTVVDQLWQALGMAQWRKAGYLSFRWIVESEGQTRADYRHDWNRVEGTYRVEGTNRDKQHFVALFNTGTRKGEVYVDGEKVTTDSTLAQMLEHAYGRFINDSYWLIMPYKLKDPGVVLTYEGQAERDGSQFDVLKVTFENVGLTPGDTYWAYIDRKDHLMKRWEYFLEGWDADRERTATTWEDWRDFGGVRLALNKRFDGRDTRIYFENVKVAETPDAEIFKATGRTF